MIDLEHLIELLERIAKRNGDDFRYRVEIESGPGGILYRFAAYESEDCHEFVSGDGATLSSAIREAHESLLSACEDWGYILPV